MIRINQLTKHINNHKLFDRFNLTVSAGSAIHVSGANGAGKSTLFNLLSGLDTDYEGEIQLGPDRKPPHQRSSIVTRIYQKPKVLPRATVMENLYLASGRLSAMDMFKSVRSIAKGDDRNLHDKLGLSLDEVNFSKFRKVPAGALSLGQQKLLSVLMCELSRSEILLVDEVFAGVDSTVTPVLTSKLLQLKASGKTLLLIEHRASLLKGLTDDVVVLK